MPDPTHPSAAQDDPTRRLGWLDLGIAVLAAAVLYAIGIAIIWAVPDDAPTGVAGVVQYAVSGLAPLGAFAAVFLRVRDPHAFGLRPIAGKWVLISIAA